MEGSCSVLPPSICVRSFYERERQSFSHSLSLPTSPPSIPSRSFCTLGFVLMLRGTQDQEQVERLAKENMANIQVYVQPVCACFQHCV